MRDLSLGKLEKIDLRNIWKHEALDFTQWLAIDENIAILSEEIGIDIIDTQTEVSVGSFSVDILAEDTNGDKVVIENQLEPTNHDHLGKLITYASGLGAKTIIWIVKKAREEHHQAIDWLNENTTKDANFFLIEVEAWAIGNSLPAVKFNIIARPNDWAKLVKQTNSTNKITDTKLKQQEFWNNFKDYASQKAKSVKSWQKALPQHWYNIRIGSAKAKIATIVNSKTNSVAVELYIYDDKDLFMDLYNKKEEIEDRLGINLDWRELPDKKASRVIVSKELKGNNSLYSQESIEWLTQTVDLMAKVFPKYIK
jgi:hypothetical protein